MTLEDYFRFEMAEGKIDFWLRAAVTDQGVEVYIHPNNRSGTTTPMLVVKDNTVTRSPRCSAPGWDE